MNDYKKAILQVITNKNKVELRNRHKNIYELVKGEHGTYDEYYDYFVSFYLDENDKYIKHFDVSISTSDKPYDKDKGNDTIELWNNFINNNKHLTFYELLILYFGENKDKDIIKNI